jgi:hypothetical protein
VDAAVLDGIVLCIVQALQAGERVEPAALQLLVRQYAATGREDLGAALAWALTTALDERDTDPAAVLALCADAARVSDDDRLARTAAELARSIRASWGEGRRLAEAMRGIDACLRGAEVAREPGLIQGAVDELERLVSRDYEPGDGLADGGLADQLWGAAALLTGYEMTGRLPYAMLADELARVARTRWWRREDGLFEDAGLFTENCEAASLCCRLASLYADADYCEAAVRAPDADYAADAGRLLAAQAAAARARGARAAVYGLALGEWLALRDELH